MDIKSVETNLFRSIFERDALLDDYDETKLERTYSCVVHEVKRLDTRIVGYCDVEVSVKKEKTRVFFATASYIFFTDLEEVISDEEASELLSSIGRFVVWPRFLALVGVIRGQVLEEIPRPLGHPDVTVHRAKRESGSEGYENAVESKGRKKPRSVSKSKDGRSSRKITRKDRAQTG